MPTVAERIDPTSPHYDAAFAELRRKAFAAFADHEEDMKTDANYRVAVEAVIRAENRRIKRALGR